MKKFSARYLPLLALVAVCLVSYVLLPSVSAQESRGPEPATPKNALMFQYVRTEHAGGVAILRSKIPGGWLVKSQFHRNDAGGCGLTFVPDPEHTWDGTSLDE